MSKTTLTAISIDALKPGMYVTEITHQTGAVKIKSSGRVGSQAVIDTLKKRGVRKLIVDMARQDPPADSASDTSQAAPATAKEKPQRVSFSSEIIRAEKLHKQGKAIQKSLLATVKKGLPFDDKIPQDFSQKLVASIDRNPDALLCLTKIREKDDYLLEHSLNVAIILANFGRYLKMDEAEVEALAHAGFLHDLGKIQIPDAILHKPGRLSDDEMQVMKQHVQFGVEALQQANIEPALVRTVSEHHERLDGLGYPAGTAGQDISHAGRMLAIADMYDALTAERVYKPGMSCQKALKILLSDCPARLDKALVDKFIHCMGVFPVGSLVKLNTNKLAMVMQQNASPAKPVVKIFYSVSGGHYVEPKDVDLASDSRFSIESAALASDYNIDVNSFFERSVAI